jgi:hypothetical protein
MVLAQQADVQTEEEKPKSAEWAREDRWASSHRECE